MKEVVREQKKEDFTWWSSIRSLTDRRLVAVLGITLMVHLCGISVVTAYLVDIFATSSISPLALLLVSSFSEMGFSFLQLIVADSLGRKTFLIICGLGISVTTLIFAAVFARVSQSKALFDLASLAPLLSHPALILTNLSLYYC